MQRRHLVPVAAALAFAGIAAVVAPAGATVMRAESFSGTDSFVDSGCGYPIRVDVEYSGSLSFRVGKNRADTVFFLREQLDVREVHTNVLTGEWFVIEVHRSFRDVKATPVEGSVYEVTAHEVGQPFVVEDSTGRVVLRDRGRIQYRFRFDTEGDDVPGGVFVEGVSIDVRGPHAGFDRDYCSIASELAGIGSTSSQRVALHPAGPTDSPLGYGEYLPPDYHDDGLSPLLVFLHGARESGDGSAEQLTHLAWNAIPRYIAYDGWPDDRPFVVLAPQHRVPDDTSAYSVCDGVPFGASCASTTQHKLDHPVDGSVCFTPDEIEDFLTYAVAEYDVDPARVYLTGLSCGAFGGWEYLAEPGGSQVAAAVLVAGEGRPAWDSAGCALGDVPVWATHGQFDDVVDPQGSIVPIEGLQGCGAPDAKLTLFADAGHDAWSSTYPVGSAIDVFGWMLDFTRP
jgi:poly(3-hydroxybutyrate) depolymerase